MVAGGIHRCGRHGCACYICSLLLEDQAPTRWTDPPCAGAGGPSAAASGPGAAGVAASPKQTSVSQGGAFQQRPADPGSPRCVRCVCVWLCCVARRRRGQHSSSNCDERAFAASKGQCRNNRAYGFAPDLAERSASSRPGAVSPFIDSLCLRCGVSRASLGARPRHVGAAALTRVSLRRADSAAEAGMAR